MNSGRILELHRLGGGTTLVVAAWVQRVTDPLPVDRHANGQQAGCKVWLGAQAFELVTESKDELYRMLTISLGGTP